MSLILELANNAMGIVAAMIIILGVILEVALSILTIRVLLAEKRGTKAKRTERRMFR